MAIESVEAIPISHPLPEGGRMGNARGTPDARSATLVRIKTTDGLVGWGEAFASPETTSTLIEERFTHLLEGRNPYTVESLAEEFYTNGYHFGGSAYVQSALSGIDMALWDIKGKQAGEPIHHLLGGRSTDSVIPYASTGYFMDSTDDIEAQLRGAKEDGFSAVKIKIGCGVENDVSRVEAVRATFGDDAHVMVDFNGNYQPKRAIRAVEQLQEYDLTWVEEPVPPENYSGYRELSTRLSVPIAAGEAHFTRFEFKQLIDDRLVDIVQPNVGHCGGFSEARRIADLATTENVRTIPHVWSSGIGVAAAVQFLASVPDYPHSTNRPEPRFLEFDRSTNPLRHEILDDPFDPTHGEVQVPQSPGLGVSVDEDAVEKYRLSE